MMSAIPNALSIARLLVGIAFPFFPLSWRVWLVLFAALSDLVDGFASRYLNATSVLGRILDPIADKVFVAALVITLIVEQTLTVTEAALIGLRDLVVLAGIVWIAVRGKWAEISQLRPTMLGKVATTAQFVLLLALLYYSEKPQAILVITAILSGLAALDYVRVYRSRSVSGQAD